VNDENADCRDQILKVMRALITCNKLSQSKIKTMLNTVLQMGSSDPEKHQQLALAKLHGFNLLAETSKLKGTEIQ
jgi:predicted XRE-type DNA-binding protein